MSVGVSGGVDRLQMYIDSANSKRVAALIAAGGSTVETSVTGTYATGGWFHAAAVFTSNSLRSAYYNGTLGAGGVPSGTPLTPSGLNRLNLAARYATTLGGFLNGSLAEACMWNVALSAEEIAELASGFSPEKIRPQNRVHWNRLIRESQDIQRGAALTEIGGATTVATHPRIIYP
jgi:hypothetical protein